MLSVGLVLLLAIPSAAAAGRSSADGLRLNMRMVGTGISRYCELNIRVFIQISYYACMLGLCVN